MDPQLSNTKVWTAYFERAVKRAESGEDPSSLLKLFSPLKNHFSSLSAEVTLKNSHHFADLQILDALRLDLIYWESQRAVAKKWSKRRGEEILKTMGKLGSDVEDQLDLLGYLGKDGLYLRALKLVLEKWERFPEKMRRPRPFPPKLAFQSTWGREECYDALSILDMAFKANWKPGVEEWKSIALPLTRSFLSMGLPRYAKDVLDLHPEQDLGDELKGIKKNVEKLIEASEGSSSDGDDLY
jgi:hypothetical protein